MKCFQCGKEIGVTEEYVVQEPDGDFFHENCLAVYEKERDEFFNEIVNDDKKFNKWISNFED